MMRRQSDPAVMLGCILFGVIILGAIALGIAIGVHYVADQINVRG